MASCCASGSAGSKMTPRAGDAGRAQTTYAAGISGCGWRRPSGATGGPAARPPARGRVRPVVADAVPDDARGPEAKRLCQLAHVPLFLLDQIRAGLGVAPFGEAVAQRPDASANPSARLDHDHRRAARLE